MVEIDGKENLYVISVTQKTVTVKKILAHSEEKALELALSGHIIGVPVKIQSVTEDEPEATVIEEQLAHERDIF